MDVDPSIDDPHTYTILRIKRKRAEEPLDALVVDSDIRARRRKTRGGFDIFQYAETVEREALENERQKRDLQQRITTLARTKPSDDSQIPSTVKRSASPVAAVQPPKTDEPSRRYSVVKQPSEQSKSRRMPPSAPPKVISHKEAAKLKPGFAYYDAVLAADKDARSKADSEMDKFVPLLEEYLKIGDIGLSSSSGTSAETAEDDFVWDIFYHYPVKLNEWSKSAVNIGTLTGLPSSFGHPDDSDSESEVEDDEDEDSNAEDYYTNDYPDEDAWEDSNDSDKHSDRDDLFADHDYDSDEDWIHSGIRER